MQQTFEDWLTLVDRAMLNRFGFTSEDCEDWSWRDAYDDETSVSQAVHEWAADHGL